MKNNVKKFLQRLFLCFTLLGINACSPKIQKAGLRAPLNIKVDGETLEWPNNKLQAYNPIDRIKYTICNDDTNLYLTISATDLHCVNKIIYGGITFAINNINEKKATMAIKFPVLDIINSQYIVDIKNAYYSNIHIHDGLSHKKEIDSLFNLLTEANDNINQLQLINEKDSVITNNIDNKEGIKAVGKFNSKANYTYELSVSLKYLSLSVKNADKFNYNIRLNGQTERILPRINGMISIGKVRELRGGGDPSHHFVITPSDFEGEYILAKK